MFNEECYSHILKLDNKLLSYRYILHNLNSERKILNIEILDVEITTYFKVAIIGILISSHLKENHSVPMNVIIIIPQNMCSGF